MSKASNFELKRSLIKTRENVLEIIQKVFRSNAVEGHIFGSFARGNSDAYSDIDIWFTFDDQIIKEVLSQRFDLYSQVGEILHICEAPQNAPLQGVQSSVAYKTSVGYLTVDYSLCPLSTSYIYPESKRLFGIELPEKTMGYNPQKVQVGESYRIDFFISFIFSAVKQLLRNKNEPLKMLFDEYENLIQKYNIPVEVLQSKEQNFTSLILVSENIKKIANEKQKITLDEIEKFVKKMTN